MSGSGARREKGATPLEWLIWFDVMMIVGIVAFLGFINAMGWTSRRGAGK
jgi:hypothetical protein